jgi:hypothetical protein
MMMTAALAAALAAPGAAHAKDCTKVSGPFSAVPPATCASPVGICTHGRLTGGLSAAYDFVADSQTVVFPIASLTGHSTITIDKGGALLLGEDTSALSLLTGDFDFATGATAGTYSGTIRKKGEDEADGVD